MAICTICKKTDEEIKLYPGILESEMVNICEECAEDQGVPIIKKPSQSQLTRADETYSVRQRLDRMSGRHESTEISGDQAITQHNLAKLRIPKPKQNHPEVHDNYYWTLSMARRRAKMTHSQLAKKIGVSSYEIQAIEKGAFPKDFKTIFLKLEALLGIKLLKAHEQQVNFTRKSPAKEQDILKSVAQKMNNKEQKSDDLDDLEGFEEIEAAEERIELEEIRLSRRRNLQDVTLNDLVDRKRAREKYQQKTKQDEMMGEDIDFDEL